MNEEEKEAIKYFYNLRATIDESNMLFDEDINVKCGKETIKQITTVLNLLEKKDKQIEQYQNMLATNDMLHVLECEKKDKIIYEIAKSNVKLKGYDVEEAYINNTISFYTKYIENLERNPHWRKEVEEDK